MLLLLLSALYANQKLYVEFKNNKHFSDKELYEALGLETPSWWQFYKDKRAVVDKKVISSLQDILKNFYKSEGFYHIDIKKEEDNTTVIFDIDSGKANYITDIISDLDKRYEMLIGQKRADRFKATKFIDSKREIKSELLKDSYCNFILEAKAYVDIEENNTTLKYHLQKNSPCHFGEIEINLPKDIDKKVVLSRLNFHKGSLYKSQKIRDAYSSISGLETFSSIQIKQKKSNDSVDVVVNLAKRKKSITQEIGVGYETNFGFKGLFRWEQRNFHGDARKVAFDLKYSQKEQHIKNSIFWPAFTKAPLFPKYYLDLKNEFSFSKYQYNKFNEEKIADYLHLMKDYYLFSIDSGLGFEKIYINKTGEICNISDGHFFLFYPFIRGIYDTRDSKIDPKNGYYLSIYLESGMKFLASSASYSKFMSEARVIRSWDRLTLSAKTKFGFISEIEKKLPESKRFFAGGAFSNRAYGYNRLGATDSKCNDMGGRTLIDSSFEANYWIYDKFGVGVFYDTTMITQKSLKFDTDFKHSIGAGIRYLTPIGPIKLDFGLNLEDSSQHALHFQIGQSF